MRKTRGSKSNPPHFKVISNAGENQARKIADQFEQFREVFHNAFPKLRVDLGKPLVIFAGKKRRHPETPSARVLGDKGRLHPAGIFMPGEARHYVAVRTNIDADNPYEVVYHEYTHAIMDRNFQGLPVWLGEGLAEYFANSAIHDKEVEIGKISPYHLQVLQSTRLIPVDALMQAGADSPYYNEQNRATVFYAESWAIVHYLLTDPGARKRQLLTAFFSAWDASGNQLDAAAKVFGDLKNSPPPWKRTPGNRLFISPAYRPPFMATRKITSAAASPQVKWRRRRRSSTSRRSA